MVDRLYCHINSICHTKNLIYYSYVANYTRHKVLYRLAYWLWSKLNVFEHDKKIGRVVDKRDHGVGSSFNNVEPYKARRAPGSRSRKV